MDKKKKIVCIALAGIMLSVLAIVLLAPGASLLGAPVLAIETPNKLSAENDETVSLDVTISHLGDVSYPAASMSIYFDPAYLEFLGVEEGNVMITDTENSSGRTLPTWQYNVEQSNKTGQINIMYLDMTGGENTFTAELLHKEDNVLLRLNFRLRGSVRKGDVCDLIVEDAVFAASDEAQSLSTVAGTLRVKNGKLVMAE